MNEQVSDTAAVQDSSKLIRMTMPKLVVSQLCEHDVADAQSHECSSSEQDQEETKEPHSTGINLLPFALTKV